DCTTWSGLYHLVRIVPTTRLVAPPAFRPICRSPSASRAIGSSGYLRPVRSGQCSCGLSQATASSPYRTQPTAQPAFAPPLFCPPSMWVCRAFRGVRIPHSTSLLPSLPALSTAPTYPAQPASLLGLSPCSPF